MAKFHINKKGDAASCRATKGNCPFGGESEHYFSREAAQVAYEAARESAVGEPKKKVLVLSDIDGTLVRSSLVLESAAELHGDGRVDVGDLADQWRADMKNEALIRELAETYRYGIVGKTAAYIRAGDTVKRLLAEDANFYATLKTLLKHKEEGAEVILISGSPDFIVEPFAKEFGFKSYASKYMVDKRGRFTGEIELMAGSEAKQGVLDTLALADYDEIIGLGDTASDLPLLKAAHHAILVDPTDETIKHYEDNQVVIKEIVRD